jgi:hypothetical protein
MNRLGSCVVALLVFAGVLRGSTPLMDDGCVNSGHAICAALLLEDPERRLAETRTAIQGALLSSDPVTRGRARSLLSSLAYTIDLYPYLDLIESFGSFANESAGASDLADQIELRHAPRDRRIKLLAPAIRTGEGRLPRSGGKLYRPAALYLASRGGLDEFQPAVAEYLAALEPERIRHRRQHTVLANFELCGGAESFTDGPRLAFQRLLQMREGALEERFSSDEGFREAVLDLVRDEYRAFGARRTGSAAAALIRQFVARQAAFRAAQPSVYPAPLAALPGSSAGDWLIRLRETAPDLRREAP